MVATSKCKRDPNRTQALRQMLQLIIMKPTLSEAHCQTPAPLLTSYIKHLQNTTREHFWIIYTLV